MFKKLIETLKIFKGIKGMIVLKCDNCSSIDLRLMDNSLQHNDAKGSGIYDLSYIQYHVKCNKCGTLASVRENWFLERRTN